MAPKKKSAVTNISGLSKDDIFKAIKAISKDSGLLGREEIVEFCTVKKLKTGVPSVDYLLAGGISEGKITIFAGKESSAKCLGKNTPIMMFDGSIKMSQDIKIGDKVMGDDGTYRNVISICSGKDDLYKVSQSYGEDYIVNSKHILSVKYSKYGNEKIKDINVVDFYNKSKTFRLHNKGFKVGVNYPETNITIDPYYLGLWLGDGSKDGPRIHSDIRDKEVHNYLQELCNNLGLFLSIKKKNDSENGCRYDLTTKTTFGGYKRNILINQLRNLKLINNKHIPKNYLYNSRSVRLKLFAGLIDSDGSYDKKNNSYVFSNKNINLIDNMVILSRSLGYKAVKTFNYINRIKYYRVYINSEDFSDVPVLLPRKKGRFQKSKSNPLYSYLTITPIGIGEYYGFEVDGNKRFLLGDFTVTHNSTLAYHFIKSLIEEMKLNNEFKLILIEDVEDSFDPIYAESIGIDLDYIYRRNDKVIEDGFAEISKAVSLGIIKALVIDSLDGMIAKKVDENAYQNTMGGTSGALAMHLPNLHSKLCEHNVTTIIIKQARVKLNGFNPSGQELLTFNGGKALRHFADTILMLGKLSNRDLNYIPSKVKAEKTRSSRMGLDLVIPVGNTGIDCVRDLVKLAELHDTFNRAGTWYTYKEHKVQGIESLIELFKSNKEMYQELFDYVYNNIIDVYGINCDIKIDEEPEYQGEELNIDEVLES